MSATPNTAAAGDPSMEDILASIRKILSEDEAPSNPPLTKPVDPPGDVLSLDASMIVEEARPMTNDPVPPAPPPPAENLDRHEPEMAAPPPILHAAPSSAPEPQPGTTDPMQHLPGVSQPGSFVEHLDNDTLVGPEPAAAVAGSVHSLLRKLAQERTTPVYRNGPTLEDIVREEMRPLLKTWLDSHIPAIVERLVRAEIERVVNRAGL